MSKEKNGGVIYCRVSDSKQVEGTSLASQERQGREFLAKRKIEVAGVFVDKGESAKTANRVEFLRALDFCRKNKRTVGYFSVWKLDRFARNTEDHFLVRQQLRSLGISLLSVTEPIGDSPSEKFLETLLAASAEFDNSIRKQRCIDGMSERINQGIYPWKPPIGYLAQGASARGEKKREPDNPDPVVFPMIQRALLAYKSGAYTQADLVRLLQEAGLDEARGITTRPQLVDRILGQYLRFYAGLLDNRWTGKSVSGRHKPMITADDMHRISLVRDGKVRSVVKERRSEDFRLRRTLRCACCGAFLTGSAARGRGGRYYYYHCFTKGCDKYGKSFRRKDVEEAFVSFLAEITPSSDALDMAADVIREEWSRRVETHQQRTDDADRQLAQLKKRRERIFDAFEQGEYSQEVFHDRRDTVERQIAVITPEPQEGTALSLAGALKFALATIGSLPTAWSTMTTSEWSRFQKIVLPAGIQYDPIEGFRTPRLSVVYGLSHPGSAEKSPDVRLRGIGSNQRGLEEELRAWGALERSLSSMTDSEPHK